jgi:hypothetical protein
MKTTQLKNILTALAILLAIAPAMAQTDDDNGTRFNTGVSIRQQLMNGTAPGLKFAPVSAMKTSTQQSKIAGKDDSKRSLSEEIKNGTLGGLPVSGGGSKPTFRTMSKSAGLNKAHASLPSDNIAEPKKAPVATPAADVPSQGEEKAPAAKQSKVSAKEPIKANN